MAKKDIPQAVKKTLDWLIENERGSIEYLGTDKDKEYYEFAHEEQGEYGMPIVVEYNNSNATIVPDSTAIDILQLFPED